MAKKKDTPKYTADDFRKLKARMLARQENLVSEIEIAVAHLGEITNFDSAVELRDLAQTMCTLCGDLGNIDMYIQNAEMSGELRACPFQLSEYGLG